MRRRNPTARKATTEAPTAAVTVSSGTNALTDNEGRLSDGFFHRTARSFRSQALFAASPTNATRTEIAVKAGSVNATPAVSSAIPRIMTKATPARYARPVAASSPRSVGVRTPDTVRMPNPAASSRRFATSGPSSTRTANSRDATMSDVTAVLLHGYAGVFAATRVHV